MPEAVQRLASGKDHHLEMDARRLGRIVERILGFGRFRSRCLFTSLVLLRLLRCRGEAAVLVIGLPSTPKGKDAHAWVELEGVDVGPPPGRGAHVELTRYG